MRIGFAVLEGQSTSPSMVELGVEGQVVTVTGGKTSASGVIVSNTVVTTVLILVIASVSVATLVSVCPEIWISVSFEVI